MRILVFHGTRGNLGDAAMLEAVVLNLLRILPAADLFVVDRPGFRSNIWNLPRVRRQPLPALKISGENALAEVPYLWRHHETWRTAVRWGFSLGVGRIFCAKRIKVSGLPDGEHTLDEFCAAFDALHVAGGGYLTDTFPVPLVQLAYLAQVFVEQGKPVVLTGQQVGPFHSQVFQMLVRRLMRGARFVGLREPICSLQLCEQFRLKPECFRVTGDDSFGLPCSEETDISACLAAHGLQAGSFLAFNVRVGDYALGQSDLECVARIAEELACSFRLPVVIVPIAFNDGDNDDRFGKHLLNLMRHTDARSIHSDRLSPALVRGLLGKAFGAVGVSYHFCTFALSQGVPAVALHTGDYYQQKGRGLCGFWRDPRLAIPLRNANPHSVAEHISALLKDWPWREKLAERARFATGNWRKAFDEQVQAHFGDQLDASPSSS